MLCFVAVPIKLMFGLGGFRWSDLSLKNKPIWSDELCCCFCSIHFEAMKGLSCFYNSGKDRPIQSEDRHRYRVSEDRTVGTSPTFESGTGLSYSARLHGWGTVRQPCAKMDKMYIPPCQGLRILPLSNLLYMAMCLGWFVFPEQLRLASPRLQDCCEVRKYTNS